MVVTNYSTTSLRMSFGVSLSPIRI